MWGASFFFWTDGRAANPPIRTFSPTIVFDAAFEGDLSGSPAFDRRRLPLLIARRDAPVFGRISGGIRHAEHYRIAASAGIRPHRTDPGGRKSKDDTPALLFYLQSICANKAKQTELFRIPMQTPKRNSPATVSRDHQNSDPGSCAIAFQNSGASLAARLMSSRRYPGT